MDISDLKKALRLGRLSGLYFWNFEVFHTRCYIFFALNLILSISMTAMYLVGEELYLVSMLLQIYSAIFNTVDLITGVCFSIECASNSIRPPSNWTTFFHSLQRADLVIKPGKTSSRNGCRITLYFAYAIFIAIALVACIQEATPNWYILSFTYYCIQGVQKLLYLTIMNRAIVILQRRYLRLKDSITTASKCSQDHYLVLHLLNEGVGAFNRIFGIGILIIFANALAMAVNSFNYTLTVLSELEVLRFVTEERCTMAFNLQSVVHLIITLLIIRSCDRIEAIHNDILSTIDWLQARVSDQQEAKRLLQFYVYCEGLTPKFTAAGYFRLNKDLFSSFLSSMLSYMILSVQLNATTKTNVWKL